MARRLECQGPGRLNIRTAKPLDVWNVGSLDRQQSKGLDVVTSSNPAVWRSEPLDGQHAGDRGGWRF
jgi:hypothetical protein